MTATNSIPEISLRKMAGHIGKLLACVSILLAAAKPLCAAPELLIVPLGVEGDNWAWRVDIDPDEALAGGSTPVAVELGFRLTGAPLLSVQNINPSVFNFANPGNVIFGWETPGTSGFPEGLQINTTTDEIFVAYGSGLISGATPFLKILTEGPMTSPTTTIQWLGVYGVGGNKGRIAQLTGPTSSENFDIFAGMATQTIPSDIHNWINPAGGDFATPGNWNPSETPDVTHTAAFNLSGDYTVQFSSDVTNSRLQVGNDDVTFALDGHGYTLTSDLVSEPSVTVGVAANDDAHLTLLDGTLRSVDAVIADGANSSGHVVVGAGATWINSGEILVGRQGSGALTIQQNAVVDVAEDVVLYPDGELSLQQGGTLITGGVSFQGGGQFDWTGGLLRLTGAGGLTIGAAGLFGPNLFLDPSRTLRVDGTLTIESGAILLSTNQLEVGTAQVDSDGQLFAQGGLDAGSANVAAGGQMFLGGAMHDFGAGLTNHGDTVFTQAAAVDGPVTNAAGGAITAIGDVTFNDLVDGPGGFFGAGTITFAGGMSPGASPAAVSVESDVVLPASAALSIELGGTQLGTEYDSLQIGGTAMLDGTLAVSLIDDFIPGFGATFEILAAAAGIAGAFADTLLPELTGSLAWQIDYDPNSVLLSVVLPGDFNGDGSVDAADYVVWRHGLGATYTEGDYDLWLANFGNTASGGDSANETAQFAPVPEPASTLLMLLAGVFLAPLVRVERATAAPRYSTPWPKIDSTA
jgi:T5SS/PEP-CTERM-associated repeat protein